MVKRKSLVFALMMMLASLPSFGQRSQYGQRISGVSAKHVVKQKLLPVQRAAKVRAFEKSYPALCAVRNKMLGAPMQGAEVKRISRQTRKSTATAMPKVPVMRTADGRELYGNVVYSSFWDEMKRGLYSFRASDPVDTELLWMNDDFAANGGGALVDGVFHEVNWFSSDGYIFITYASYNAETGEQISSCGLDDISLIATELAVSSDGKVYGEFYNSTATGYELGVMDYSTLKRSTIGTLSNWYIAIGITKDNVLYGVASDGNLYKIDAKTAKETLVGSTGLSLINSSGGVYEQSGEIDQKTGTFYWAAIDGSEYSALYTVDLGSGAATKVGEFTGQEQVYALTIPAPEAEDGAPAAISDLSLSYSDPSFTGTVSFTAPSATFAGETLTGELSYTIEADGEAVATGTTTAGTAVSHDITVGGSGEHTFTVTTSNTVGRSPQAKASRYIGYDEPFPVEDLTVTTNSETGEVNLSWTAPTAGYNDGFIGELKYNVTRYPDAETVAEGITATSFSESLNPEELTAYTYGVVAVNGDMSSGEATSNKVVAGPAIVPPYDNDFAGETSLDLMTVIDANGDGCTWGYHPDQHCAYYVYNGENSGDDWLLTPSLKLEAGKEYAVTFTASNTIEQYTEQLEVKYGEGDDPTAFGGTLLCSTPLTEKKEFTSYITPEKDQNIRIGFHAISEPDRFNLLLFGVHVSEGHNTAAPDSVSNFRLIPDAEGAKSVKLSFTLPDKTIGGAKLQSLEKAEIIRDGNVVKTLTDGLVPGQAISCEDNVDTDATYAYKVLLYNGSGAGRVTLAKSAFVGTDIPAAVDAASISVRDNATSVDVSWNGVTLGQNGGYVDSKNMSYNLYDNITYDDFYGYEYGNRLDSVCGVTNSTITMNTDEGEQQLLTVFVQPQNVKGLGGYSSAQTIVTGSPYTLPYSETFDNGSVASGLWWMNVSGSSSWYLNGDVVSPAGGQPGVAVFDGCGDESYFATGKISPAGASNMKLYFNLRSEFAENASMTVQVQKSDGTVDNLKTYEFDSPDDMTPWLSECLSLSKYANERYIIVRFLGNGRGLLPIDNVQVRDVYSDDLAAAVSAPEKLKKGETGKVTVMVTNCGENNASAYSIRLFEGDKAIETKDVADVLAPMETDTLAFDYTPSIFLDGTSVELTAQVVYVLDKDRSNNTASATLQLIGSQKPAPASATVCNSSEGAVIEWTAPADGKQKIAESFEDYDTWTADNFGGWTCIDGDKGYAGALFNGYDYGNQGTPFAFEIFEPNAISSDILESNPEMTPHTGNKYAAAVFSVSDDSFLDADNWLISPSLSGEKQTVKFFALNQGDSENNYPETIELLYSTAGTDSADFKLVKTVTVESGAWEEVTFDVPQGAVRFAIHHITAEGGFMLGIDDVEYVAGNGVLTGYNIYRDNVLLKSVGASDLHYVDAGGNDGSVYAVTAVYTDGESAPTIATLVPDAIHAIEAGDNAKPFNVYTVDGKLVGEGMTSTRSLAPGIYVVNGQKITVR